MKYGLSFAGIFVLCLVSVESDLIHSLVRNRNDLSPKVESELEVYISGDSNDEYQDVRIANGSKARKYSNPYFVSLSVTTTDITIVFCGGSLITLFHVLTAASCLWKSYEIRITLGTNNFEDINKSRHVTYVVKKSAIKIHEDYEDGTHYADLGIITLPTKAPLSRRIKPVLLPLRYTASWTYVESLAKISGFGASKYYSVAKRLRFAQDRIITNTECVRSHEDILASHICMSGSQGKAACSGDRGGPLTINDHTGRAVLVAVISFGPKTCRSNRPTKPTVGTRVVNYLYFITSVTGIQYP